MESKLRYGLFQIITGLILLSFFLTIIIYLLIIDWFKLQLEIAGSIASPGMYGLAAVLLMVIPIMMIGFGSKNIYKSRRKPIIKDSIVKKVEAASEVTYKLRKPIIKEMVGTKMEAAPNVAYMLRIEKEVGDSGAEMVNYICGYCEVKNNLKTIDEEHGIFQCLNCGAENHLLK